MIYREYYELDLKINDISLEFSPQELNFSIHDSIHNVFSSANIYINDTSGLMREFLFFNEGNKYSLTFGIKDLTTLNSDYIVESNESQDIITQGILSCKYKLNLLHNWYSYQEITNKAYTNRISLIVRELIQNYRFKSIIMNDTSNNTTWYQLGMNQKDFIEKVLLQNAYSFNMDGTTFVCFIDVDNNFQFRNIKSLFDSNPVAELVYAPQIKDNYSINVIQTIKPFSEGLLQTKKTLNRTVVYRDLQTGEISTDDDDIMTHPINSKLPNSKLPILGNNNLKTDYKYYSWKYTNLGEKDSFQSRIYRDQYKGYFLDKFIIMVPFNPLLKSGSIVKLNLSYLNDKNQPEYGLYQSGNYLIEDCIHTWNANKQKIGTTELIVSRKFVFPSSEHKLAQRLIN